MQNKTALPKTLFPFLLHFLKPRWKWLVVAQVFLLGWSLDHALWPYIVMLFVDTITNFAGDKQDMWSVLSTPLILGATLWITVQIFFRISGWIMAKKIPKLEASIRMSMFDYVLKHSYTYFSNHFAGNMANKIADMPRSVSQIIENVMELFIPVFVAFILSLFLFAQIQPVFAGILFVWIVLHMTICLACAKKCDHYANTHAESRSELSGMIVDSLTNHLNVKLFSRHSRENEFIGEYQQEEIEKNQYSRLFLEKMKASLALLCFLMMGIAVNWYMLLQWQQNLLTTGEIVFIFNSCWSMTMMAWQAGLELPNVLRDIGICNQALTVIQDSHDVVDAPFAKLLHVNKGEIIFDDVTFSYSENRNLFQNKNIIIQPGEKIGLVGFSGSGKTTFVHLILRYFDLNGGQILIDGQNIAEVTQDSLRESIAIIPQDTTLFHRSLLENIRCGSPQATDEEVIAASKQAHCHEFIEKLPEGYETLVGERGIKLSGGQRQRIAIARAILKNAPVLILDEATSALDSVTEKLIQESLHDLMQKRTTIVIAHRLSTLTDMDRILVFKEGKIVEEGTHEALLAEDNHYATLWHMQTGGFLPEDA